MIQSWNRVLFVAAVVVVEAGCGSSGGAGSMVDFAGTYNATYAGTYAITSPPGTPGGSNTATATIAVTNLSNGELGLTWTLPANPPSGVVDFSLSGTSGMALGPATGGQCFVGDINGNTQTNCCTQCSITFDGNGMFSQPNAGTFTATTATGANFSGTYDGVWTGTKQ